jgi:hypothetical protein
MPFTYVPTCAQARNTGYEQVKTVNSVTSLRPTHLGPGGEVFVWCCNQYSISEMLGFT